MNENTPERIYQPDKGDVPDYVAIYMCLTAREEAILNLIAEGASSAEIAEELQITIVTVWQAQQRITAVGSMWENSRRMIDGPE